MRRLGLQKQRETTDLAERLTAADSSGTAAKDEAGVAAAIGNSSP
jgi:hypothetical protein